ncbi:MAG: transglycosylase domain-containing protein, partial [Chthoniobacterales bacterium]
GASGAKQGGSTFTMQLIKNAFFGDDVERERAAGKRTLRRKIKEMLMIPMVEGAYAKKEILTYYLNLINLTSNAQGVLMASMDMFKKENLNDLNLAEMALLAAQPKGTSAFSPWRHPEAAKARRDLVLDAMADQGYISASDRDHWKSEPIKVADLGASDQARVLSRFFAGHITNYFGSLKKKNLRDTRWTHGGFDIKTSFNLNLQKVVTNSLQNQLLSLERGMGRYKWKPWIDTSTDKNLNVAKMMTKPGADVDDAFEYLQFAHPYPETNWVVALKTPKSGQWLLDHGVRVNVAGGDGGIFNSLKPYDAVVLEPSEKGVYRLASGTDVQGAVVVLDAETGEVLAMSGGFTAGSYGKFAQNNRVTRSMRMPGSTIKPITYLYALNHGVAPNLMLRNAGVRFPKIDNCPYHWAPHNYGGSGGGNVIVRQALEHSMNLPVVNLFVHLAGLPAEGDFAGVSIESANKMRDTLYGIYDLAVSMGAYTSRESLAARNSQQPCFPYLLGGFETTPLNMAQAYAAIANGGLKRDPIFLRQVFKNDQPLVVDHTEELRGQVQQYREAVKQGFNVAPEAFGAIPGVSAQSVAQLHSLMQGVLRRGTATRIKQWAELIGGKTGTTNDSKDVWFDGYTNKIAVVTWIGYDDDELYDNLGSLTGGAGALPVFENIMNAYFKMNPGELNDPLPNPEEIPGLVHAKE